MPVFAACSEYHEQALAGAEQLDENMWITAVDLNGYGVRLEPLQPTHAEGLAAAAADGQLWRSPLTSVPAPGEEAAYIAQALRAQAAGERMPFAVLDAHSGEVLGSTSYHDILPEVRRLEIGYTWYRRTSQRTHVNSACKFLLLQHAFETLQAQVAGWRTDILNHASQRAIERLGARKDGIVRGNKLRRDGTIRDTVMYSMTASEWPAARARLLQALTPCPTAPDRFAG